MHIAWGIKPQPLLQVYLFRRFIQQVKAANDVIDVLQIIINHYGKLISNNPVFTLYDKIAVLLGEIVANRALQFILKSNDTVIGFNAQCMRGVGQGLPIATNAGVDIGLYASARVSCQ